MQKMCARISTLAFIYGTKLNTFSNHFKNEQKNALFVNQNIQLKRMENTVMVSSDGTAKNVIFHSTGKINQVSGDRNLHGLNYGSQKDYLSDF